MNDLTKALFLLLSHSDDDDISMFVSYMSGWLLSNGKLPDEDFDCIVRALKKD